MCVKLCINEKKEKKKVKQEKRENPISNYSHPVLFLVRTDDYLISFCVKVWPEIRRISLELSTIVPRRSEGAVAISTKVKSVCCPKFCPTLS